ncbi:MAG TPA: sigma-54-dependent Fis family transcriptional regulator [candidate division Zixibacteria bacterium]|nr:sigma-54-dependent Fis family transcriptional regulator [candidate division Zixibacteria bacterium]
MESGSPLSPERQNQLASELLKICQRMNSERDLGALLELIANEATKLLEADRASLFLLDREKNQLWSRIALGSDEIRFDARLGVAGSVVSSGAVVNVRDAQSDPRFFRDIDLRTGYVTRSLLAVPLRNHDRTILGVFEVLNKTTGAFGNEDEEILKALAAQAAIAIETAQLLDRIKRHRDRLQEENAQLWKEVEARYAEGSIVGGSDRIRAVLRLIRQIGNSAVNVLITGESGTGKELAAKAIHYGSLRARKPFVALNCAALPEALVESELFGIEKGVATGVERRIGKIEASDGGTLFLDEIGDLSLAAQAKLLRVLQEKAVERVGGRKLIPVDLRVLSATNKNLEAEIRNGSFREDLYYRLKVIHIEMPPLREIPEDIALLARHFLASYCREAGRELLELTAEAEEACRRYRWPGNVRELENEMRRLAVSVTGKGVSLDDLSAPIRAAWSAGRPASRPRFLKDMIADLERRMIQEALQESQHNQLRTAKALGLSRHGLIKKMKRYNIRPQDS